MEHIVHYDKLNKEIKVNDFVVFPSHNMLEFGIVKKVTPKMIKLCRLGKTSTIQRYPSEMLVLEGSEVTMYILRHQI